MSETCPTNFLCTPPICSATAAATAASCARGAEGAAATARGEGSWEGDGSSPASSSAAGAAACGAAVAAAFGNGAATTRGCSATSCGSSSRLGTAGGCSAGAEGVLRRPPSLAGAAGELRPVVALLLLADRSRSEGVSRRGGDCTLASAAAAAAAAAVAAASAAAAACCASRCCSVGVGGGLGHSSGVTSPDSPCSREGVHRTVGQRHQPTCRCLAWQEAGHSNTHSDRSQSAAKSHAAWRTKRATGEGALRGPTPAQVGSTEDRACTVRIDRAWCSRTLGLGGWGAGGGGMPASDTAPSMLGSACGTAASSTAASAAATAAAGAAAGGVAAAGGGGEVPCLGGVPLASSAEGIGTAEEGWERICRSCPSRSSRLLRRTMPSSAAASASSAGFGAECGARRAVSKLERCSCLMQPQSLYACAALLPRRHGVIPATS